MANKNIKWTQDLRKAAYTRLVMEFGPYATWGMSKYPSERKDRYWEVLAEIADYASRRSGQKIEPTGVENQVAWAYTAQKSVNDAGFAYQYILNKAAALETGFITSAELRGFTHHEID